MTLITIDNPKQIDSRTAYKAIEAALRTTRVKRCIYVAGSLLLMK